MAQEHMEIMLAAYRHWLATGSETARDVALDLADRNCAMAGHVPAPSLNDNTREEHDDRASAR